jgi:hypothetical protein
VKLMLIMGSIPIVCITIIVLSVKVEIIHFMDAVRIIKDNGYGFNIGGQSSDLHTIHTKETHKTHIKTRRKHP